MDQYIQENGKINKSMEKEYKSMQMVHYMRDIGKMEKQMDMEEKYIVMGVYMMGNG